MPRCPSCVTEIPASSRFCPQCGKPSNGLDPEDTATIATLAPTQAMPTPPATPTPGGGARERFAAGALVASRYRIVSQLGKGGMGEVYRADDLILGQPVALKFLPPAAKDNLNLLTRFYDEVRIARQISHKNVCRVYDIGEVDGQPYLSMEYIDGEDLGSLLRRIGRLPADKAIEFARKLCAGVAAAHAQGVLHRDIKPANIMIDARGELRITDFGLAAVAEQLQGAEIRNGTPAYMAPEQLAGEKVSVQSDLYAVGLVLYEMFTGKLPFQANTLAEMTRLRQESRVTTPSTFIGELDKNVERAILRCLEADPAMRPSSALALAAMLPGGDPLAAALAEGETPSPEAVAAAGSTEALSPKIAIPALAGILIGIAAFCLISPRLYLINLIPMENSPDVLAAKARDIARSLGYTERAGDSTAGFFVEPPSVEYMRARGHNMNDWARIFAQTPNGLGYWYRQSPTPLVSERSRSYGAAGIVDPPVTVPGMFSIALEMDGRLRRFAAVPPDRYPPATETQTPDWAPLFAAARLDPRDFKPVAPEWTPPFVTDVRAAWTGPYPGRPDLPVRVEAAYYHGRPVFFQMFWPWTRSTRLTPLVLTTAQAFTSAAYYIGGALVLIAAIWIAHFNWKAGRGDMRGATRIGIYCAAMSLLGWLLRAHHVASQGEQGLIGEALANAAFVLVEYWLIYLALEPWVRRYWPQALITWSRVLAGRWRDPLVGRDLLFGSLLGIVYLLFLTLFSFALMRSGLPNFSQSNPSQLNGFRAYCALAADNLLGVVAGSLMFFLTFFLLRVLLRKQWAAAIVWVAGWAAVQMFRGNSGQFPENAYRAALFILVFSVLVLILLRLGFFALVVSVFVLDSMSGSFVTTDFSAWYGASSLAVVIMIAALALWGFRLALASRPLFRAP